MSIALTQAKKIYLKTYGCAHNHSDSEYMAGQLRAQGYDLTDDESEADLVLINSCTVKGPSQESFLANVRKTKANKTPLIVAGCVPQAAPNHSELSSLSVVGVQQIDRIVEVVEETLQGNTVRLLGKEHKPSLDLPKERHNPLIEIIPINSGCLSACTYCKTKHARGHLSSYTPEQILRRVTTALSQGVKEFWITSEDTGAYGKDLKITFPQLLSQIVAILPPDVRVRIGMTNPPYILEHLDEIAQLLNHPNVYAFLHIPVQSGSDAVLQNMKRGYSVEEFCNICDTLLEKVPQLTLATDIICGFPHETEEDFAQTLALVQKYKFPILHISQFYPRPGTVAASMPQLARSVVKQRSSALTELFYSYQPYAHLHDSTQEVLITQRSRDDKQLVGHTKNYTQVILDEKEGMGSLVKVQITGSGRHHLSGTIIPYHTF